MATLPSSLALTGSPADGGAVVASTIRNDFAAVQTEANALLTILGGGTALQFLQSGGGTTVSWAGAYTAYTPTWTSLGVAPAIGNGTVTGRYLQVGKIVHGYLLLTAGGTTTFGTGTYSLTLPVTAAASVVSTQVMGTALATDVGVAAYTGTVIAVSPTNLNVYSNTSPATAWTNTVPFTFGNTDLLAVNFTYEAA